MVKEYEIQVTVDPEISINPDKGVNTTFNSWVPETYTKTFKTSSTTNLYDGYNYTTPSFTYWWYPQNYYYYQVFCPKRGCKKANWLQLDTPKPCTKCGSILKAVSQVVDFEIPIEI